MTPARTARAIRVVARIARVAPARPRAARRPLARRCVDFHARPLATARSAASPYDALAATLDAKQREQMLAYARALIRENKGEHGMLTGATSAEEVLESHASDALALLKVFDDASETIGSDATRVLDVGSGAIARPGWRFTLLDTLRKRTNFLEATTREIGLTNVDVVWGRAEDLGRDEKWRESFDVVTARAVAELRVLAEFCVPLARVGGYWISPKNAAVADEIRDAVNAVTILGGGAMCAESVDSIGPDGNKRTAVVCEKLSPTPDKYPRRAGMAKKRPL